jgi:hypothetical protein
MQSTKNLLVLVVVVVVGVVHWLWSWSFTIAKGARASVSFLIMQRQMDPVHFHWLVLKETHWNWVRRKRRRINSFLHSAGTIKISVEAATPPVLAPDIDS